MTVDVLDRFGQDSQARGSLLSCDLFLTLIARLLRNGESVREDDAHVCY